MGGGGWLNLKLEHTVVEFESDTDQTGPRNTTLSSDINSEHREK
jgi:hypothetical protein